MSELKPCPFCGGAAVRFTIGEDEPNNAGGDCIGCQKCGASSHVEFGRKENLVSRWNTRASPTPSNDGEGVIETYREALKAVRPYLLAMRRQGEDNIWRPAERNLAVIDAALNQGAGR